MKCMTQHKQHDISEISNHTPTSMLNEKLLLEKSCITDYVVVFAHPSLCFLSISAKITWVST